MRHAAALMLAIAAITVLLGLSPPGSDPTPRASEPQSPPEAPPLVVMSFNIRYGTARDGDDAWPKRQKLVIDRMRESNADIIGLQEALRFQIDELLAAMPGYKAVGVGRDDGREAGEHVAILYRHSRLALEPPVPHRPGRSTATHGHFWLSETPEKPGSKSWGNSITRMCTWARLREIETDRAFIVFNTHLDHESQPSRVRSVELIKQRIANREGSDPVIVTGDFNAGQKNEAIHAMLATDTPTDPGSPVCPPLRDTFRVADPKATTVGTFNGFKGVTDGEKIDYIFVDDRWEVLEASIDRTMPDGRCPSDHFPVIARLRCRPPAPKP